MGLRMAVSVERGGVGERQPAHVLISPRRHAVPNEVAIQGPVYDNDGWIEASLKMTNHSSINPHVLGSSCGRMWPPGDAGRQKAKTTQDRTLEEAPFFKPRHSQAPN
jgi:hypothetical protein